MRFSQDFLDEIRARIPVSQLVMRRVTLKKQGREWRGLSPFNKERTPSFYVNDQKGIYHCFSSNKTGDVIKWLVEVEGLQFVEAVERLAAQAGLQVPKSSPEATRKEAAKLTLIEVVAEAESWFRKQLHGSTGGARAALDYARSRMSPAGLEAFGVGYAPADRYGLKEHLGAKGVTKEAMVAAGLLIHGDDIPVPYDRFRDRLMFPIKDLKGRTVAFGGRALAKDAPAKYLNSPETEIFHKGAMLYNGHAARPAALEEANALIVVEGYIDVTSTATNGFPASVAPMGTAMTADQMLLAWRMSDAPVICLDGDKAGTKAAYRVLDTALPLLKPGRTLRFARMPGGLDPDEVIRRRSPATFREAIEEASPLIDMIWRRVTDGRDMASPDVKAVTEKDIEQLTGQIPDDVVKKHYARELRDRLFAAYRRPEVVRSNGTSQHSTSPASHRLVYGAGKPQGLGLREAILVAAMVTAPSAALDAAETLSAKGLSVETRSTLDGLINYMSGHVDAGSDEIVNALSSHSSFISEAVNVCRNAGVINLGPGGDISAASTILKGRA